MTAEHTPIAELTQEQYESMSGEARMAVDKLLYLQAEGFVSEASSDNDLTPLQLAVQYGMLTEEQAF